MWLFVSERDTVPADSWKWVRVSTRGVPYQRSPSTYPSLGKAIASAMLHGFEEGKDQFRLVEQQ